jgi:hypothetical protein
MYLLCLPEVVGWNNPTGIPLFDIHQILGVGWILLLHQPPELNITGKSERPG